MGKNEKVIRSRSGRIVFNSNGTVIKELNDPVIAAEEYNVMVQLHDQFPGIMLSGWLYKTIEPFKIEDNKIVMERAEGEPLNRLLKNEPDLAYYPGTWLAAFHSFNRLGDDRTRLFSDTSLSNVIIDKDLKTVIMLDPGGGFGRKEVYFVDLLSLSVGLITFGLKNLLLPAKMILPFFKGYYDNTENKAFNNHSFNRASGIVIDKYKERWRNRSFIKKSISSVYCLYLLLYLRFVLKRMVIRYSSVEN